MIYPDALKPNRYETHTLDGVKYNIPVVDLLLKRWDGPLIDNTFGGKPLANYKGMPMFAELAIQRIAVEDGWSARWVETYAQKGSSPYYFTDWLDAPLTQQVPAPLNDSYIEKILLGISFLNGNSYSGCWDVLVWKNKNVLFMESKRNKKDNVRITQLKWLKESLSFGLTK
ncbi:hypothetical protein KJ836_00065, partial [Patescibacteria group bacterium]|nr:hypothetical protein [Patescibacteria group bacterium]